nr:MAG TPA: hypothetical protein [Bacteriophage sp.]DAW74864.1 MAG TPA: hypothetical protein [Ackermannviridae sp.]
MVGASHFHVMCTLLSYSIFNFSNIYLFDSR